MSGYQFKDEQKVKDRTAEVEQLLKQKDEFIGQLGHDLKNPLVPITNLLPVLKKKIDNPAEIDKPTRNIRIQYIILSIKVLSSILLCILIENRFTLRRWKQS